jgi:hypothetical protein
LADRVEGPVYATDHTACNALSGVLSGSVAAPPILTPVFTGTEERSLKKSNRRKQKMAKKGERT